VTGTSGFVGSALSSRLLDRGHQVVGLTRDSSRVPSQLQSRIELVVGDALKAETLKRAMDGCDAFVWLIHSMEHEDSDSPFAERELVSASLAVEAAQAAGTQRAVYLGGILPADGAKSPHLASRLAVEQTLLAGLPNSTALRASIVIGARSRSFRFLTRLVSRMPALPLPGWSTNRTAPVDERDVLNALVRATEGAAEGMSLDVSGPETITYGALIELIADRLLLERPTFSLPFSLTPIAGQVAAAVAGEQPELIVPLMESLGSDLLPRNDGLASLGVKPHRLSAAIDRALFELESIEEIGAR